MAARTRQRCAGGDRPDRSPGRAPSRLASCPARMDPTTTRGLPDAACASDGPSAAEPIRQVVQCVGDWKWQMTSWCRRGENAAALT